LGQWRGDKGVGKREKLIRRLGNKERDKRKEGR